MHKFNTYFIFFGVLFCLNNAASAQQGQTFYFMDRISQTAYMNPSLKHDYDYTIGGLLLPIVGQVPPTMYFNYSNNGFDYADFIHHGTGDQADSLVYDPENLLKNMRNTNHLHFQTHIDLIHVGFKTKDEGYLTFNITEKIDFGLSLPKDLFGMMWYGNNYYRKQDEKIDLSGLGFQFMHYREIAGGFATEIIDNLEVGGRGKILFGMANAQTDVNELSLYTGQDDYMITAVSDMAIHSNTPLNFNYYHNEDSTGIELDEDAIENYNPLDYPFNFRNPGFALDIGARYTYLEDYTAFISVNDLGFISWNENPFSLHSDGTFGFRGIEVDFFEDEDEFEENMEEFGDSVLNIFAPGANDYSYITWLPTDLYLGGQYHYHEMLNLGMLYRMEFYRKDVMHSFTLSANSNITDWLSTHLSYSIMNNKFTNVGLGLTIRGAFLQYYIVTDNLFGAMFPQSSRNLNIRMGCNLVFGYKEIISESLF